MRSLAITIDRFLKSPFRLIAAAAESVQPKVRSV